MTGLYPPLLWAVALLGAVISGVLMVVVHPLAPVVLLLGGCVVLLGLTSPFYLLLGFLAVLFLRPAEFFPFLAPLQLGKVIALGALGLFILRKLALRDKEWAASEHNKWMILLTVAIILSSLFGSYSSHSFQVFKDVFVKILVLWLLIMNLVNSKRRAYQFQYGLAITCAILGGYVIYIKMSGQAQIEGSRAGAVGMLGDPNDLALTMLMVTPFLVSARLEVTGKLRTFTTVLLVCTLGGIISTQSRGGLLGLMGGLSFILLPRVKNKAMLLAIGAPILLALAAAMGLAERKGLESDGLDQSAEHRIVAWTAGMHMFKAHPILGVGFEQFPASFINYTTEATDREIMAAHNSFVKCVAEVGLAGFIPFCMLVLSSFVVGLKVWRKARDAPPGLERAYMNGVLGNFVSVMISCFFLSQTWLWFIYIVFAQTATAERIWLQEETA